MATLIWRTPGGPSGTERSAGPVPQIEFRWSVPEENKPLAPAQLANGGPVLPSEIAPARRARRHHELAANHHRSKHHHRHSEVAHISASTVSEATAPAEPAPRSRPKSEVAAVEERLRSSLGQELYADFDLYLYVSNASSGPLAQQMYVFRKEAGGGALRLLYDWPVSTGRDRTELNGEGLELSTSTPTGYFELDPHRFYRHHVSMEWQEPMPFAMFFRWIERGRRTGVAIHAATKDEIAELGTRASAGCIRLSPDDARTLFTMIRGQYRGLAPRFAIDHRTGTMSSTGIILHDASGRPELTEGYKVLVVVENYGGTNLVAAMY